MNKQETFDKLAKAAWLMWGLSAGFYFFEFMLQVSPSVMVPNLMRSFDVTARNLGLLASTYFFVYAPMQLPVGILLDRFGPRRLLLVAAMTCTLGAFLFSIATSFALAVISRGLIGFGSAFAIVGCMKVISNWFPANRFAMMLGLVVMIGMLGAVFGQAPLAILVTHFDWRHTMQILAIAGCLIVILMFFILHDHPESKIQPFEPSDTETQIAQLFKGLKLVIRNSQTWLASVYGCLMFAPTLAFAGLWGVPFLEQAYSLSPSVAAANVSLIFIGWAVGSPLAGWISDQVGRRKITMYSGTLGALVCISAVIYLPTMPIFLLQVSLFLFGVFSSGFLMAFPIVKEINPPDYNATAMGFVNTLNSFGGAILQPLVGMLLDMFWSGMTNRGAHVYSTYEYQLALSAIPMVILISLGLCFFIKETYCQPCYELSE